MPQNFSSWLNLTAVIAWSVLYNSLLCCCDLTKCVPTSALSFDLFFFFLPFFSLWAPKGVTYRAFAGGCYKWKFSNHSISFVTWAKWCVHGRGFLGRTESMTGICHWKRASTLVCSHFNEYLPPGISVSVKYSYIEVLEQES